MANNVIKRVWNQNRMVTIEDLKGMTFQAESGGHTFQISGVDDAGNVIALSGSVAGVFLRPDNTDVAITGSASGGVVSVTLPANCYDVPGRFGLTIFVTANGKKTAVYAAMGTVSRTSSGTVSPGTTADVVDLINRINAAVATIPASWTGLMADIAPAYSDAAVYPVGAYCYYNGDLYRCTTAITTAESWTAGHWTQAVFGNDVSDLKSAFTNEFYDYTERTQTTAASGWRLNESNGLSSQDEGYQLKKFTVTAGDVVKVVSDDRFQFQTIASVPSYGTSNRVGITYGTGTFVLVVPETATYLIVSTPTESGAVVYTALSKLTDLGNDVLELNQSIDAENRFANRIAYDAAGTYNNNGNGHKIDIDVDNGVITLNDNAFGATVSLELTNPVHSITGSSPATNFITFLSGHTYKLRTIPISGTFTGLDSRIYCAISINGETSIHRTPASGGESVFTFDNDTAASLLFVVAYETTANVVFQYELVDITESEQIKNLIFDTIAMESRFENRLAYDASGIFNNSKLRVTVLNGLISIADASFGASVYLEMKNPINQISGSSSATRYLTLKANHEYRLRTIPVSGSITGNDNQILLGISSGNSSMDYSVTILGESIKFSYDNDTTVSVVLFVKYETTAEISFQYELADITDPDAKPLVPDYFISQMQTVRTNVQNDLMTVGRHGDNFVFITDIHWRGNYKHSPGLIKYLTDGRMVNLIVNGGDLIDGSSDKAAQIAVQMQCINAFNEIGIPMITAVGNHDYNSVYGTSANYFSDEEYFATAQHQNALEGMVYGGDTYFYWDKVSTKTRYIVLDSGANNIGNGTTIPSEQITWIQGIIGNTPADYHIIVVVHDLGNYKHGSNPIDENNPFIYIPGAQTLFDTLDALNANHMIEAVFFGHTHYDANYTTSGGIPLISTNSDAKWQYYEMMEPSDGTVDSQCFDVVTIDYLQKKIYMRRVGRGSDRVITYGT